MKRKIFSRPELSKIREELRSQGKRVAFTNGCFDILHIGHLRYLQEARSLADYLIIGLNTDDSVRRLKGPERPFVLEDERAEMMAGLECVDFVTLFDEPTPIEIITELQPDLHVKGGDYTISQIPEARIVHSYGGEVLIIPPIAGKSTSGLVSHVRTIAGNAESRGDTKQKVIGIIPARIDSKRLPNKPMLDIAGKPMLLRAYENAKKSKLLDDVFVATPDEAILQFVESFGGKAVITSATHASGTNRVAEAARTIEADIIVNIPVGEMGLNPADIDALVSALIDSPDTVAASLTAPLQPDELDSTDVVKVVTDNQGFALYFSRSGIPHRTNQDAAQPRAHIDVCAYRRTFLIIIGSKDPSQLELAESIEQLRILENGRKIMMLPVTGTPPASINTAGDLQKARACS